MPHSAIGDAPLLPELLDQIPADGSVNRVSSDGAYDRKTAMKRLLGAERRPLPWRSLIETQKCGAERLGGRVMAGTFERQVFKLHVRLAILNRFNQIDRPQTVAVA